MTLAGFRLARPGVLPGTTLDGVPLGGLDRTELTQVVESYAEVKDAEGIRLQAVTEGGVVRSLRALREEAGFTVDRAETTEQVWHRGRQLNPVLALADHVRALGSGIEVAPSTSVDDQAFERWVSSAVAELDADPVEGELEIVGTDVVLTEAEPGLSVERDVVARRVRSALEAGGEQQVRVPAVERPPEGDPSELEELAAAAEVAVSGPVRLSRGEAALELSAKQVGDLLEVRGEAGARRLHVDPEALSAVVDEGVREALEKDPVDATVRLSEGQVVIGPSEPGFGWDPEAAATQLVELATSQESDGETAREAELEGRILEPDLSTAEAEALEISERVSSFTTEFRAGQSRVQNIHRMAELVDGVVVRPGETFSINEHVGPRTREKGFTEGGVIEAGEFTTAVGGGVSQFATTFFNAAFFGGYEILQHQPHSYYISRYPEGREATLNYPDIDVVIRNDSPYGLLIDTSYTSRSVTVAMWGREWVDVEERTSQRRDIHEPRTAVRENPDLPPGETRVVQSGRVGFTVSYTRILNYHDGRQDEQTWTHTYRPEPRIIERGPSG
jgi:vancomycin resistance protein YoaR